MTLPRRAVPVLAAVAILAGACGGHPVPSPVSSDGPSPTPSPTPVATEIPFAPAAFPVAGSACDAPGYTGRLGRIEATDERTIVFTLCAPDGAFLARLAHPALSVVDATSIAAISADPVAARTAAGSGRYRVERWVDGDNVVLARVAADADADAVSPTVIIAWAADPAARLAALTDAAVDGIDAPGPAELDQLATLPELQTTPRDGLATAYLAFGAGPAFAGTRVRRAFAEALDRATLVAGAFPAGTVTPTHLTPCIVDGACGGKPWYEFNAPAADAILADASFDRKRSYPLHVPDAPIPGLPDPAGTAAAIVAQLAANLGVTVEVDVMAAAAFREAVDKGTLNGLYLDAVVSPVADASGFLEPLFGEGVRTTPARRATGVSAALLAAASTADPAARATAIEDANTTIRTSAVVVPLAHAGSAVAFRGDVTGVATSPLGVDPLGATTPGDRPQLVFLQAGEPAGAWCGDRSSIDAFRVCGLVGEGLYGFDGASVVPQPRLARCEASEDARTWTCTIRPDRTFSDGMAVDAGDVLASFAAGWDATGRIRTRAADGAFAAWDALLGGPAGGG